MNLIERAGLKGLGWRLKRMDGLKRWLPLIGSAVLALAVVARLSGQEDAARAIEVVANLLGLSGASAISGAELAAAATVIFGIVRKVRAEVRKASARCPFFATVGGTNSVTNRQCLLRLDHQGEHAYGAPGA